MIYTLHFFLVDALQKRQTHKKSEQTDKSKIRFKAIIKATMNQLSHLKKYGMTKTSHTLIQKQCVAVSTELIHQQPWKAVFLLQRVFHFVRIYLLAMTGNVQLY